MELTSEERQQLNELLNKIQTSGSYAASGYAVQFSTLVDGISARSHASSAPPHPGADETSKFFSSNESFVNNENTDAKLKKLLILSNPERHHG
jgi:hypothetical protein